MPPVLDWFRDPGKLGLDPGIHKFDGVGDLEGHRFHLRVDTDEKGVLMVDASSLIFLNGTAVDVMRCLLEGRSTKETVSYMRKRYRGARKGELREHITDIKEQLMEFLAGNMNVIKNVGTESPSIGADDLPAPYRMDLALTYDCQNDCGHCYNEERDRTPMKERDWLRVIDILWRWGIPHIVFTGGEPTLSPHLKRLIERSEENGQITGLVSNGRRLSRKGYLRGLIRAGLDHVQITVLSHRESLHDELAGCEGAWKETIAGLKMALEEDIYVNTNTTIMRSNHEDVEGTMDFLMDLGVRNIAFNSIIRSGKGRGTEGITYEELAGLLEDLVRRAGKRDVKLIWYSPTPYCEFNPVNYGLGIKQCTACSINMAVEPDGTVLPCQSCYDPLGNILEDDWKDIWGHELCREIREREYVPDRCMKCDLLEVCGGGCPLSLREGEYMCTDRASSM